MPNCPHCEAELTSAEIGKLLGGLRKTHGTGRGRPVSLCECGHPKAKHHALRTKTLSNGTQYDYCCDVGLCTCLGFVKKAKKVA